MTVNKSINVNVYLFLMEWRMERFFKKIAGLEVLSPQSPPSISV